MDLRTALRVILRNWVVLCLALATAVATAYVLQGRVAPDYQAHGSVLVLSPASSRTTDGDLVPGNPFSRFGSSEAVAATAIVSVINSPAFALELDKAGVESDYTVTLPPSGGGAIVEFTVTSASEQQALGDLRFLMTAMNAELAERQRAAGAPQDTFIKAETLTFPAKATVLIGSKVRVLIVSLALGMVLALSLTFLADSLRSARTSSRRQVEGLPRLEPPPPAQPVTVPPKLVTGMNGDAVANGDGGRLKKSKLSKTARQTTTAVRGHAR